MYVGKIKRFTRRKMQVKFEFLYHDFMFCKELSGVSYKSYKSNKIKTQKSVGKWNEKGGGKGDLIRDDYYKIIYY